MFTQPSALKWGLVLGRSTWDCGHCPFTYSLAKTVWIQPPDDHGWRAHRWLIHGSFPLCLHSTLLFKKWISFILHLTEKSLISQCRKVTRGLCNSQSVYSHTTEQIYLQAVSHCLSFNSKDGMILPALEGEKNRIPCA